MPVGLGHVEAPQEAPAFDLGFRTEQSVRFSTERPELSAYRGLRLSEVAGLPPVARHGRGVGMSVVSDILKSAAEAFATNHPELAIRLVLRVCGYDKDETLMRILSRTRVAMLSTSAAESIADSCMEVIKYALPRAIPSGKPRPGIFWIERLRVAMEVLSRMVLRLAADKMEVILDNAVEYYRNPQISQEPLLGEPLGNLLQRAWEALPSERRTTRSLDLLGMPIMGLDNFLGSIASLTPDPGDFLQADDLPAGLRPDFTVRWREAIDLLIRGLEGEDEPRKRASMRVMLVSDKKLLTATESLLVAKALWSAKYTAPNDLPGGTPLYDWAFFLLPEPNPGIAERCFRLKWLSGNINQLRESIQPEGNTVSIPIGKNPANPASIDDILWNVGSAISGLRNQGQALHLTDNEQKYIADVVEQWVTISIPKYSINFFEGMAREPARRAIRGLASILVEEAIAAPVCERLYKKLRCLGDSGTPCIEPVAGLVKKLPDRYDELVTWVRMGLVSHDRTMVASAMSGLHSWMVASAVVGETLRPPPNDLLREIGLMIASRRSGSLVHAVQLAKWVFTEGTQGHRDVISALTIEGLSYLAEELSYDRDRDLQENADLPLLRLLCTQLAQLMAQYGFKDELAVSRWLEMGLCDPLPEVRYAVAPIANPGEVEEKRCEIEQSPPSMYDSQEKTTSQ